MYANESNVDDLITITNPDTRALMKRENLLPPRNP